MLNNLTGIVKRVVTKLINELVNLNDLYKIPVRTLSLGQKMLCDIAASFLHNPDVIFLDEPTIGLDVEIRAKVRLIIKELNRIKKTTVLLSSHDVGDIESLAGRIIMIDKGHIIYDGPTEKFTNIFGKCRTLRLDVRDLSAAQVSILRNELAIVAGNDAVQVGEANQGWLGVGFDQDRIPLVDLLNPILRKFDIKDIKVEEIEMEEVIKRVYGGALK